MVRVPKKESDGTGTNKGATWTISPGSNDRPAYKLQPMAASIRDGAKKTSHHCHEFIFFLVASMSEASSSSPLLPWPGEDWRRKSVTRHTRWGIRRMDRREERVRGRCLMIVRLPTAFSGRSWGLTATAAASSMVYGCLILCSCGWNDQVECKEQKQFKYTEYLVWITVVPGSSDIPQTNQWFCLWKHELGHGTQFIEQLEHKARRLLLYNQLSYVPSKTTELVTPIVDVTIELIYYS